MRIRTFVHTIHTLRRHRLSSKLARIAAAGVVAATPLTIFVHATAVSDVTPMSFTALSASTTAVNVNAAAAQVAFVGPTQDDLSGYGSVSFYYTSPSGKQVLEGNTGIGPDQTTFTGSIAFPRYAEPGLWLPTFTLADRAGNSTTLSATELAQAGYDVAIAVTSDTPDTTPPSLTSISLDTGTLALSAQSGRVLATITTSDEHPENMSVLGRYVSPSGKQSVAQTANYAAESNTYLFNPEFSPYAETGTWSLYLTLKDQAANTVSLTPDDILQLTGSTHSIFVSAQNSDTTPPTLGNLTFTAPNITDAEAGASLALRATITDNLAGVGYMELVYKSADTTQATQYAGYSLIDGLNDTYDLNVVFPLYAASAKWLPELHVHDEAGNEITYTNQDLLNLGFNVSTNIHVSVVTTATENQTVTTDATNSGATVSNPLQASVQTPTAGTVSISTLDEDDSITGLDGYYLIGQQVTIHAPEATAEAPLTLTFTLDASLLDPGQTAENIVLLRNGVIVEPCIDQVSASPSPCIFSRVTLAGGDIEIKVHTIAASAWAMAFPTAQQHLFKGFKKPVKQAPVLNKVEGGETVPVKFDYGDNTDVTILASQPTTQAIDCTTLQPYGDITPALSANGHGLKLNSNAYRLNWKTLKAWKHSCRQLTFRFESGEVVSAYFKIEK